MIIVYLYDIEQTESVWLKIIFKNSATHHKISATHQTQTTNRSNSWLFGNFQLFLTLDLQFLIFPDFSWPVATLFTQVLWKLFFLATQFRIFTLFQFYTSAVKTFFLSDPMLHFYTFPQVLWKLFFSATGCCIFTLFHFYTSAVNTFLSNPMLHFYTFTQVP